MTIFNTPPQTTKYKFEDFQKSEMIKEETIDSGFIYTSIAVMRDGVLIFLKQTVDTLNL